MQQSRPASLALIASPAGIAVLFITAVYFAAATYASYQQMNAIENVKGEKGEKGENGKDGANGKDANFAALAGDAIKKGEVVVEKEVDGNEQLSLKLSATDYKAFTHGKNADDEITLNVFLTGKSVEVKFNHVDNANDNVDYKVQLTSVGSKNLPADMKAELGMADDSKSLKVAVSSKNMAALKADVTTNLVNVVAADIHKGQTV